jgi:hypothetical protein
MQRAPEAVSGAGNILDDNIDPKTGIGNRRSP